MGSDGLGAVLAGTIEARRALIDVRREVLRLRGEEASAAFDRSESEALAVVDGPEQRRVIGMLTESHTLKRYSDELERQRRTIAGEPG